MFNFNFYVNADLSAQEKRMSDLEDNQNEIRAIVEAEKAQSAEREAKLAETSAKVDALTVKVGELTELINSGTFPKEQVLAFFSELKETLPNIVPPFSPTPFVDPDKAADPVN